MDIESGPHEQDVQAILPASADAIMTEREPQEPNEQWAHARWSHDFMLDEPPHSRRRWLGEYVARLLRHTYAYANARVQALQININRGPGPGSWAEYLARMWA